VQAELWMVLGLTSLVMLILACSASRIVDGVRIGAELNDEDDPPPQPLLPPPLVPRDRRPKDEPSMDRCPPPDLRACQSSNNAETGDGLGATDLD
jgi:hypothetical protein